MLCENQFRAVLCHRLRDERPLEIEESLHKRVPAVQGVQLCFAEGTGDPHDSIFLDGGPRVEYGRTGDFRALRDLLLRELFALGFNKEVVSY